MNIFECKINSTKIDLIETKDVDIAFIFSCFCLVCLVGWFCITIVLYLMAFFTRMNFH